MPYYIASLNIEHAYYELTGEYEPFEGLCFVDTLDMAEARQKTFALMTEENTARVDRQRRASITVVIGNPPYNIGQLNENDNNKNRKYAMIDRRISETYAAASKASNKTALSDAYVNFFRWGTDRLNRRDGMLCLVSNNSFIEQVAFDGFRKHVRRDFDDLFHIDLEGNVRANPKLSGTDYNVFGIQLGVGITVAVRSRSKPNAKRPIKFRRVDKTPRRENKLAWLAQQQSIGHGKWQQLLPENDEYWLVPDHADEFKRLVPIAARSAKAGLPGAPNVVLREFSRGVATCRDAYLYDFDNTELARRVKAFIEAYNIEVDRYRRANKE